MPLIGYKFKKSESCEKRPVLTGKDKEESGLFEIQAP